MNLSYLTCNGTSFHLDCFRAIDLYAMTNYHKLIMIVLTLPQLLVTHSDVVFFVVGMSLSCCSVSDVGFVELKYFISLFFLVRDLFNPLSGIQNLR